MSFDIINTSQKRARDFDQLPFSNNGDFLIANIIQTVCNKLKLKELLIMRRTSLQGKNIAEIELINRINNGSKKNRSEDNKHRPVFRELAKVKEFFNEKCSFITMLNLQNHPFVTELKNEDIEIIPELFPKLEFLLLDDPKITKDSASSFAKMTSLKGLGFVEPSFDDFSFIENIKLKELIIDCLDVELQNVNFIKYFPSLEILKIQLNNDIITMEDFTPIKNCKELKTLNLTETGVTDISFVEDLSHLESLTLKECFEIENFNSIERCTRLKKLDLSYTIVNDISFIKKLVNLETLILRDCDAIRDFSPIKICKLLKILDISKTKVTDISFMRDLSKLVCVDLTGCKNIEIKAYRVNDHFALSI